MRCVVKNMRLSEDCCRAPLPGVHQVPHGRCGARLRRACNGPSLRRLTVLQTAWRRQGLPFDNSKAFDT